MRAAGKSGIRIRIGLRLSATGFTTSYLPRGPRWWPCAGRYATPTGPPSSCPLRFVLVRMLGSVFLASSGAFVGLAVASTPALASGSTLYAAPNATGSGNCADTADACTFTTALADAVSGDTVSLAAGTYQPASGASFTVSTSITVQPTVPGSTVVLAGNGNTVLVVDSTAAPVASVTISGVVVEGGAGEFYGGGIADYQGTLTVEDSTISGNTAGITGPPSTTGYGGGIWSEAARR